MQMDIKLFSGVCYNLVNDYKCHCKGGLEGKRCEVGFYCKPNPCKNGGMCTDGINKPICNCIGFKGKTIFSFSF